MRRLLGHEEDGLELGLALGVEVGIGEKIEVILGDALADRCTPLRSRPSWLTTRSSSAL